MKSYYGGHPVIAWVIANAYFHMQQAEGAANFNAGWNPIPNSVIGLTGRCCCKCSWLNSAKTYLFLIQIHCALSEYSTGTFKEVKFVSQYAAEYWEIMMHLHKLQAEMKGKYHNMKKHLTDHVM